MKKLRRYKIARRLGAPIFEKTQSQKFALTQSKKTKRPAKLTDYGKQLLEKQKARFTYGLSERQFSTYVKEASKGRADKTVAELFKLLETRLDNVVYRSGLAKSREAARQMVTHGHISVNGRKLNIPSYRVKGSDKITAREGSKNKGIFTESAERMKGLGVLPWIKIEGDKLAAEIIGQPNIEGTDLLFDLNSVIEFYNR